MATEPGRRPPAYGGAHWGKILDGLFWVRLTFVDVFGAGHSFQVPARLFLDGTRPIDQAGYFNDADSAGISLVREAADRLAAFGVDVDGCHLEAGPGQYELDLAPHAPVALADALVLAKRVLRGVATSAGLR